MTDPTSGDEPVAPCPVCAAPVPARRAARAAQGDETRQRGSCLGCGLQLVRDGDEPWREIRG